MLLKNLMKSLVIALIAMFSACSEDWELAHVTVRETHGLERKKEYVEVFFPLKERTPVPAQICMIFGSDEGHVPVQFRVLPENPGIIQVVFPVSLPPHGLRHVSLLPCNDETHSLSGSLIVTGDAPGLLIENPYFIADLGTKTDVPENNYPPGHLTALTLKALDSLRIQRSGMKIHWSPNFAKQEVPYQTMAHMEAEHIDIFQGKYMVRLEKSGKVPSYEEIGLKGAYTFYDSLPYFIFTSEMEILQTVTLNLLRNDEMTIDSMFTDLAFRREAGEVKHLPLYESRTFAYLDSQHIEANAPWLYFYNRDKHFAMGSIRLDYDNTQAEGTPAPLYEAHTKITPSAANGRYWNRRLIHDHDTEVPAGSRYFEKNAYVIFQYNEAASDTFMNNLYERLLYPLQLEVK
ncbi:MAG: hypothetical protein R3D00_17315 [Bacteroidia bacterium]